MKNEPPFLWGTATSAFQIEGHIDNDMTRWEQAGKFRENGKNPVYGQAADHWERWESDYSLLRELNLNAYRFSPEWSRIQPERKYFDENALEKYSRMTDRLLDMDITPMLTLHHFTHPAWFHAWSPWHHPGSVEMFCHYAEKVIGKLGDRIQLFITFNEPLVWLLAAYGDGKFPPGEKNLNHLMEALKNILLAHAEVYDMIKHRNPEAETGIAKNFIIFAPDRSWHPLDRGLFSRVNDFYNKLLLRVFETNRLRFHFPFLVNYDAGIDLNNRIDFWGINYYYRLFTRFRPSKGIPFELKFNHRSGEGITDLGWEIYSKGLGEVFDWVKKTGKPFYITENGIADRADRLRKNFIRSHLKIVEEARHENLPLKGYFHWSLTDNYEWLEGTDACFGLYQVDFNNGLKRTLRESGRFFADYVKNASK